MTETLDRSAAIDDPLPRWSVADVYESLHAPEFAAAMERASAEATRLAALFDEHNVRAVEPRPVTAEDGEAADAVITAVNRTIAELEILEVAVYASVATDSRDEHAAALLSRLEVDDAVIRPLLARLAEWVRALGVDELAAVSDEVREHLQPLQRLATRAEHQMSEAEEGLYAELATTGSAAWSRLHGDVTSQLTVDVTFPDGHVERLSMPAVRGLGSNPDPAVRKAAFDAEMVAWPTIATPIAAALNAIKGEANIVDRRRRWGNPLDSSLFGNSVSRATFDAMQSAVTASLPDFRRWMRCKAALHGYAGGLRWWDLIAPLPKRGDDHFVGRRHRLGALGLRHLQRRAGRPRGPRPRAALDRRRPAGRQGGRSVLHAVRRRPLARAPELGGLARFGTGDGARARPRLPQHDARRAHAAAEAAADGARRDGEHLLRDAGGRGRPAPARRRRAPGVARRRPRSARRRSSSTSTPRFLFESELFARRQRRTLGATELNELMLQAQADAYGDGLDLETRHPYMWLLKPHYYSAHFYNWPYTYGMLFGLGLFAKFEADPERFRDGYADALSRAGIESAESLGAMFGIDVTSEDFWTSSLDVCRARIAEYEALAAEL